MIRPESPSTRHPNGGLAVTGRIPLGDESVAVVDPVPLRLRMGYVIHPAAPFFRPQPGEHFLGVATPDAIHHALRESAGGAEPGPAGRSL